MAEYKTEIPPVEDVKPKPTEEAEQADAEKRLSDPAFFEYAKTKAIHEGRDINELVKDSSEIQDLAEEYETKVVPTIKKFKEFFKGEFFSQFKIVAKETLADASEKAESFLARQAILAPDKFEKYQEKFEEHERLSGLAEQLRKETQKDYKTTETADLVAKKETWEEGMKKGGEVLDTNKDSLDTTLKTMAGKPWFSRQGFANRLTSFRNRALTLGKEQRSDAEIAEQSAHDTAKTTVQKKIDTFKGSADFIASRIDAKEKYETEISQIRDELMSSIDAAGDVREALMKGLKESMARGKKYDAGQAGEAYGAVEEQWSEPGKFGTQKQYDVFHKQVIDNLEKVYAKVIDEQVNSVDKAVNPSKLQEFGKFIDESVTSKETQVLAVTVLQNAIGKAVVNSPQAAHLSLMMKRLQSKTF